MMAAFAAARPRGSSDSSASIAPLQRRDLAAMVAGGLLQAGSLVTHGLACHACDLVLQEDAMFAMGSHSALERPGFRG